LVGVGKVKELPLRLPFAGCMYCRFCKDVSKESLNSEYSFSCVAKMDLDIDLVSLLFILNYIGGMGPRAGPLPIVDFKVFVPELAIFTSYIGVHFGFFCGSMINSDQISLGYQKRNHNITSKRGENPEALWCH